MLGWPRNHPPLLKGGRTTREQPRESNMYFNYYTSQVFSCIAAVTVEGGTHECETTS